MTHKCPRCGLVYENEEICPSCGLPIYVRFKPDEPIQRSVPKMNCPECGKEMEHGVLQIQNEPFSFGGYGIRWFSHDEKVVHGLGGEFFHLYWIRKPGAICRECDLIILRWEGLEKPKMPISDKPTQAL
jgi:rRNA maturation protein Nop10